MSQAVLMEGRLQKRGFWGRWKTRYYTLQGKTLSEYADEKSKNRKLSEINLEGMTVAPAVQFTGKPNSFLLLPGKKGSKSDQLFFNAPTTDEMTKWMDRLAQQCVRSSFNFSAASLEAFNEAVVVSDDRGTIIAVNENAVDMFGYGSKAELLGQSVSILMPHHLAVQHASYVNTYHQTNTKRLIGKPRELPAIKKDGTPMLIELSLGELEENGKRRFIATMRLLPSRKDSTSASSSNGSHDDTSSESSGSASPRHHSAEYEELKRLDDEALRELEHHHQVLEKKNEMLRRQLAVERASRRALSKLLKKSKVLMPHLDSLVRAEIGAMRSANTIFREDSAFTRLMKLLFIGYGADYLEATLGVHLRAVAAKAEATAAKVAKSSHGEPVVFLPLPPDELAEISSTVLSALLSSTVPEEFKAVATMVKEATEAKLSEDIAQQAYRDAMANLFFLRFVIPAIAAPQRYGLLGDKPRPEAQQHLVLVSRVIMHLVNGTAMNAEGMERVNAFIEDNKALLDDFLMGLLL